MTKHQGLNISQQQPYPMIWAPEQVQRCRCEHEERAEDANIKLRKTTYYSKFISGTTELTEAWCLHSSDGKV